MSAVRERPAWEAQVISGCITVVVVVVTVCVVIAIVKLLFFGLAQLDAHWP